MCAILSSSFLALLTQCYPNKLWYILPIAKQNMCKSTYHNTCYVMLGEFMIRGVLDMKEGVSPCLKPWCSWLQFQLQCFTSA